MQSLTLFGPVDTLLGSGNHPGILYVVVILAVVNVYTRAVAHRSHVSQARTGADALTGHPIHLASTLALVLASYYLATVELRPGLVLSALAVGLFITDRVELETHRTEARRDHTIERPNGAIAVSVLVVCYAAYLGLFFVFAPIWNVVA